MKKHNITTAIQGLDPDIYSYCPTSEKNQFTKITILWFVMISYGAFVGLEFKQFFNVESRIVAFSFPLIGAFVFGIIDFIIISKGRDGRYRLFLSVLTAALMTLVSIPAVFNAETESYISEIKLNDLEGKTKTYKQRCLEENEILLSDIEKMRSYKDQYHNQYCLKETLERGGEGVKYDKLHKVCIRSEQKIATLQSKVDSVNATLRPLFFETSNREKHNGIVDRFYACSCGLWKKYSAFGIAVELLFFLLFFSFELIIFNSKKGLDTKYYDNLMKHQLDIKEKGIKDSVENEISSVDTANSQSNQIDIITQQIASITEIGVIMNAIEELEENEIYDQNIIKKAKQIINKNIKIDENISQN